MMSAPAAIPAITEVSFPPGLTPPDLTFAVRNTTRSEISSDNPARWANASTGAKPAYDTKLASSNTAVARTRPRIR